MDCLRSAKLGTTILYRTECGQLLREVLADKLTPDTGPFAP